LLFRICSTVSRLAPAGRDSLGLPVTAWYTARVAASTWAAVWTRGDTVMLSVTVAEGVARICSKLRQERLAVCL
jgi:hypothetical protein